MARRFASKKLKAVNIIQRNFREARKRSDAEKMLTLSHYQKFERKRSKLMKKDISLMTNEEFTAY